MPVYEEATKKLPSRHQQLETKDATYYYFSADPLKGEITYSTDPHRPINLQVVSIKQARDIIEMNKRGEKPFSLGGKQSSIEAVEVDYQNVVGQDDLTRFDKKKNNRKGGSNNNRRRDNRPRNNQAK